MKKKKKEKKQELFARPLLFPLVICMGKGKDSLLQKGH